MKSINLVFPHQLFEDSPLFQVDVPIYIIEEYLFFKQYSFHQQKIAFHRATMKRYSDFLRNDKNFNRRVIKQILVSSKMVRCMEKIYDFL